MRLFLAALVFALAMGQPVRAAAPVQRLQIDWAGQKATLILGAPNEDGVGDAGSITLLRPGKPAWKGRNTVDNWLRVKPITPQKRRSFPIGVIRTHSSLQRDHMPRRGVIWCWSAADTVVATAV